MTMETFLYKDKSGQAHKFKKLLDLPSRDSEPLFLKISKLEELESSIDAESLDLAKIPEIIELVNLGLRAAWIGTDAKYDRVVNELTFVEKVSLFMDWLKGSGEGENAKKD